MISTIRKYRPAHLLAGAVMTLVLFAALPVMALEVPPLKGRVNDYARILSPAAERQLEGALQAFEAADSTQIVVLTLPSLEGDSLEEFSIRVAEEWKIGQKGIDNGAILLIFRNDRKLRIEVGYGLEGKLTDLMAGRIIRDVIVPAFKRGSFDQGIISGVQAMMATVKGEYTAPSGRRRGSGKRQSGNGFLFPLIAFAFLVTQLGRLRRSLGTVAGGILLPVFGLFMGGGFSLLLLLLPVGLLAGFVLSLFGAGLSAASGVSGRRHIGTGYWGGIGGGGSSGGFGSGGGFGGFGGGGGGFGGGGASGGW